MTNKDGNNDKKLSCRRETARRFVSCSIFLSHSSHSKWLLS